MPYTYESLRELIDGNPALARWALIQIALLLGANSEWDVEYLEYIADVIGAVLPHPGHNTETYLPIAQAVGYEPRDEELR